MDIPNRFSALIASNVIASMGMIDDNVSVVIGSMLVAPFGSYILDVYNRANTSSRMNSVLVLIAASIVSVAIGYIVQTLRFWWSRNYGRGSDKKYYIDIAFDESSISDQLKDRTTQNRARTLSINFIIGLMAGIVLDEMKGESIAIAGAGIAAALVPPLVSSGMFLKYYTDTGFKKHITYATDGILIYIVNIISIFIGLYIGKRI